VTKQFFLGAAIFFLCNAAFSDQQFDDDMAKAQAGDAVSQYSVGMAYARGLGVGVNDSQSFEWLVKSEEQGFPPATEALNELHGGRARHVKIKPLDPSTVVKQEARNEAEYEDSAYSSFADESEGGSKLEQSLAGIEASRAQREATEKLRNGGDSSEYYEAKDRADTALRRSKMSKQDRDYDIEVEQRRNSEALESLERDNAQRQQDIAAREAAIKLDEMSASLEDMRKREKRRQIHDSVYAHKKNDVDVDCDGTVDQFGRVNLSCDD
jgi:TPR repeat protein